MRTGPHPLPVHIGLSAAATSDIQSYASHFQIEQRPDEMIAMISGIKKYQEHDYKGDRDTLGIVWQEKGASLKTVQNNAGDGSPLLLVPSLVNGSSIFNLNKGRSMIAWFSEQKRPVYILDWGTLYPAHPQASMSDIVQDFLVPALRFLHQKHERTVDVLGYCMGGTLSVAASICADDIVGRLVLLSAPWDFHARDSVLSERVRSFAPVALPVIDQRDCLPAIWSQALFAAIDPVSTVQKFVRFSDMDQDTGAARLFIDVEDWINEGVDLPAIIAKNCLQNWFALNEPMHNKWVVCDHVIDPRDLECKVLVISSDKDKLVSSGMARGITGRIAHHLLDELHASCGHISYVAGRHAIENIWKPIESWLCDDATQHK